MTGSMNALNNSIVDAIAQLSARFDSRFDSFEDRLHLIEGGANGSMGGNNASKGNDAIKVAARSICWKFLGNRMRPAGMGDAISEMD